MKHQFRHLVSFLALIAMMVSMVSVCVFPAAAAGAEDAEYQNLLNSAKVVNAQWANASQGDQISYEFRGNIINERFNPTRHFESYDAAWAQIEKENRSTVPVVLLCAGVYAEKIRLHGAVTLLGPNAGVDAVDEASKTVDESIAWEKNVNRSAEALIKASVIVELDAKSADFTFDGLAFGEGGAVVDRKRGNATVPYNSTLTFENLVFENAGNSVMRAEGSAGFAINLDSKGVSRTVYLDNIYVNGQSLAAPTGALTAGFISYYFNTLYANNVAYVNSRSGFLPMAVSEGYVFPSVEITNSCFHNTSVDPMGHIISMDNQTYGVKATDSSGSSSPTEEVIAISSMRPGAYLKVEDNIFYNASSPDKGIIHFELLNKNTVVDLKNNYFYSATPTTVLENEYLVDSPNIDQSSCFNIRGNRLVGAYKIPSLASANSSTYIDMSGNYFGDANGNTVYAPVYVDADFPRLIRTSFWFDEEMTISSTPWDMSINNWPLASVDTTHYTGELKLYNQDTTGTFSASFSANGANTEVILYSKGKVISDTYIELDEANRIDSITDSILPDGVFTVYAKVVNSDHPEYTPVYAVKVQKIGSLINIPDFNTSFSTDYIVYQPNMSNVAVGTVIPFEWKGELYKVTIGKNLFGSMDKLFSYAKNNGIEIPTILMPAGTYTEEILLSGSCVILGELHGVNPNKKPYEVIGENDLLSSAWSLNEQWANSANVTTVNAAIRVNQKLDDFVITIDGLKLGTGAGIVEDVHRNAANALVLKNLYLDNAGGVANKQGAESAYLFDFSKTYGVSKDFLSVYLYDSRITNSEYNVFGPYTEKLVIDGLYVGTVAANKQILDDIAARDIVDPYVSITNSYFDHCAYGKEAYAVFSIDNSAGDQKIKTNIVYNIDNNVFLDATANGEALVNVRFTGSNMKYSFTNNIVYDESNSGTLFADKDFYVGDCATTDVSDMIVVKGNRFVKWNKLPLTTGTAIGTQFDFSGNYFSSALGNGGMTAEEANVDSYTGNESFTAVATLEAARRRRLDYTYLNWEMTVRSDDPVNSVATYTFTKGMYGTGTYTYRNLNGRFRDVYEDKVPANCNVYELPFTVSENATAKIYTNDVFDENYRVDELRLTDYGVNTFYVLVTSADGSTSAEFALEIERGRNAESKLLAFSDFMVNESAKTITGHVSRRYIFLKSNVKVSNGATFALYDDAACNSEFTGYSMKPTAGNSVVKYVKVTSETGANSIYKLTLNWYSELSDIAVAGVSYIDGATKISDTSYQMEVARTAKTFTFKPVAYLGTTLKVYNGATLLTSDANGVYTVANASADQTLRIVATAGNGTTTATYTLTAKKVLSAACELLSIENGHKTGAGFVVNGYVADAVEILATVSGGATYQVYADYACTKPFAHNIAIFEDNSKSAAYVKVIAEDGKHSAVYKVSVLNQPENRNTAPVVSATINGVTYTSVVGGYNELDLYLPAKVSNVALTAKFDLLASTSELKFYTDMALTQELTGGVNLDTKQVKVFLTNTASTYVVTSVVPESTTGAQVLVQSGVLPAATWTVNVISDRSVLTYRDAASIAEWVKPYVDYLNNGAYEIFQGDNMQNFNATKQITRNELVIAAVRVMGLDVTKFSGVQLNFADSVVDWALPYAKAAVSAGILGGAYDPGTGLTYFKGADFATREQVFKIFVSMLAAQEGITDVEAYYTAHKGDIDAGFNAYDFADADKISDWADPYVRMAVGKYKIVGGTNIDGENYINPLNLITRAEVAKLIASMLGA